LHIEIREASEEDLRSILELYNQPSMDKGNVLSLDKARVIFNRMRQYPDYKVYVAFFDGEMVGTFELAIMDNLGHNGQPSGLIEDVVVHESRQGQGIGTLMMDYAVELCREKGCYKVALSSNLKRESAHRFYESLGFKRHGYSFLMDLSEHEQNF
jgi:GNAT superfamily N-acetyltransferase